MKKSVRRRKSIKHKAALGKPLNKFEQKEIDARFNRIIEKGT